MELDKYLEWRCVDFTHSFWYHKTNAGIFSSVSEVTSKAVKSTTESVGNAVKSTIGESATKAAATYLHQVDEYLGRDTAEVLGDVQPPWESLRTTDKEIADEVRTKIIELTMV